MHNRILEDGRMAKEKTSGDPGFWLEKFLGSNEDCSDWKGSQSSGTRDGKANKTTEIYGSEEGRSVDDLTHAEETHRVVALRCGESCQHEAMTFKCTMCKGRVREAHAPTGGLPRIRSEVTSQQFSGSLKRRRVLTSDVFHVGC